MAPLHLKAAGRQGRESSTPTPLLSTAEACKVNLEFQLPFLFTATQLAIKDSDPDTSGAVSSLAYGFALSCSKPLASIHPAHGPGYLSVQVVSKIQHQIHPSLAFHIRHQVQRPSASSGETWSCPGSHHGPEKIVLLRLWNTECGVMPGSFSIGCSGPCAHYQPLQVPALQVDRKQGLCG